MKVNLKSKKSKILLVVIIVIVILVILIKTAISRMSSAVEMASNLIEVEAVQTRDLSDSIALNGTAAGISKTNVTSKASAEVTAVNVQVGDEVTAGDVLCTFDTTDIEESLSSAETALTNENAISSNTSKQNSQALSDAQADQQTQLAAAQTRITQAQEDYDSANTKLTNDRNTLASKQTELSNAQAAMDQAKSASDAIPTDESLLNAYEQAASNYASIKSEVETLQSQISSEESSLTELSRAISSAQSDYDSVKTSTDKTIASAQNTVDMEDYQSTDSTTETTLKGLQEQLADCEIVAPCNGVVTAVNISVGDNNTPGTTIITIEDTSTMKINATVDEDDILRIEEGMNAVVTTGATGDEEIAGTVTRVVRVKNQSTTTTTDSTTTSGYAAEITVDQSDLLVGMTAKVKVMIKEKKDILAVPYDLIQTDEDGASYVMLASYNEDGTATAIRCDVTVGEEVNYYTEITGGDLKEGDLLIYDISVQEGETFSPSQIYSTGDTGTEESTEVEQ